MSEKITENRTGKEGSCKSQQQWLCVMCKSQQEKKAEDNLARQGFFVYLPTAPNKPKKAGRVPKKLKPMFPGYLFVAADFRLQDVSVIRSTFGCIALLQNGAKPAVVPDGVMSAIQDAEVLLRNRFEINQGFESGNKYELLEQGFRGHTATFLALDGRERARVLVKLLNSEHEVNIPINRLGQQLS